MQIRGISLKREVSLLHVTDTLGHSLISEASLAFEVVFLQIELLLHNLITTYNLHSMSIHEL